MNVLRKTVHQSINMSLLILPKATLFRDESEKKQKQNFFHFQSSFGNVLKGFGWNWHWPMNSSRQIGENNSKLVQYPPSYWTETKKSFPSKRAAKMYWISVKGKRCIWSTYSVKSAFLEVFVRRFKEHWLFHRGLFEQFLMWCNKTKQKRTAGEKTNQGSNTV